MKQTGYFQSVVRLKRPYLREEWIENVIARPLRREIQPDGRVRLWGHVEPEGRYLRVVLLPDGETIHNAFFDRDFAPDEASD